MPLSCFCSNDTVPYTACYCYREGLKLACESSDVHLGKVPRLEDHDRQSVGSRVMADGHQYFSAAKRRLLQPTTNQSTSYIKQQHWRLTLRPTYLLEDMKALGETLRKLLKHMLAN